MIRRQTSKHSWHEDENQDGIARASAIARRAFDDVLKKTIC
jgi:hypothetical protein